MRFQRAELGNGSRKRLGIPSEKSLASCLFPCVCSGSLFVSNYFIIGTGYIDLGEKFRAFGWEVLEIDGHSMEEIVASIDKCYASKNGKPKCIYGHTVKGKGVSFMENQCGWHGVAPNDEQYAQAMAELKAQLID